MPKNLIINCQSYIDVVLIGIVIIGVTVDSPEQRFDHRNFTFSRVCVMPHFGICPILIRHCTILEHFALPSFKTVLHHFRTLDFENR